MREIPLPEPYPGDDQGSLADHEKAGNPLKSGAMGPLVQKLSDFLSFERWTGAAAVLRLLWSSRGCWAGVVTPPAHSTRNCCNRWKLHLTRTEEPRLSGCSCEFGSPAAAEAAQPSCTETPGTGTLPATCSLCRINPSAEAVEMMVFSARCRIIPSVAVVVF